jgi:branched-chain amino acid transport system permease protein
MLRDKTPGVAPALLLALAALAAFPLLGSDFYVQLVSKIMILAILAMSLNLLVGFTGLVSLGHAAFYGLGAYALVFAAPEYQAAWLWSSLPLAMLGAGLAALLIGALVVRTTGVYFIMVTLAFAQMLYYLFHDAKFAGGSDGVYIYVKPDATVLGLVPFDLENKVHFYFVALAAMALVYLLLRVVLQSPFGRVLDGVRANEHRMRALGFPTYRYKLVAFALAGALAGLAGYLSAAQFGFVNPEQLGWHLSGEVLMMAILGGMGSLFGPIIGAFALVLAQELFSELTRHWLLLMGGFVILVVLALPNGIGGALLAAADRLAPARPSAARPPRAGGPPHRDGGRP